MLTGQWKVKPRWPPMEANFGRQFQFPTRACMSVLVSHATFYIFWHVFFGNTHKACLQNIEISFTAQPANPRVSWLCRLTGKSDLLCSFLAGLPSITAFSLGKTLRLRWVTGVIGCLINLTGSTDVPRKRSVWLARASIFETCNWSVYLERSAWVDRSASTKNTCCLYIQL